MTKVCNHTRWNVEVDGDDMLICKGDHDKSEPCTMVRYRRVSDEPPVSPAWMVEVAREVGRAMQGDEPYRDAAHAALRLALERGHVVEPREWTEEELLKAAREDAAQAYSEGRMFTYEAEARAGKGDAALSVRAALQARRNMLREGAVAVPTKAPEVDLEALLRRAWDCGFNTSETGLNLLRCGSAIDDGWASSAATGDVRRLLSTLPTREA